MGMLFRFRERRARPSVHPYAAQRRNEALAITFVTVMSMTVVARTHGGEQGCAIVVAVIFSLVWWVWSRPFFLALSRRTVQWRVRMNAKVPPAWPLGFSASTDRYRPIVETAWHDMDDVRAWLSHHAVVPPEWLVHEEQNVPNWARLSCNGTCLDEHASLSGPVLRLWLVLDNGSTWHQPYFRCCLEQGMSPGDVVYGMIAHEMGHAVDLMMRHIATPAMPPAQGRSGEAIADVWEALSTFHPLDLVTFAQRVATMASARDADRARRSAPADHDTGLYLRSLLLREDLRRVHQRWPRLPVAVRMRWVWDHVAAVERAQAFVHAHQESRHRSA